jgi:putative transposase
MCKLLKVSKSGYYKWLSCPVSNQEQANLKLDKYIKVLFTKYTKDYGYRRIYKELLKLNLPTSINRVRRRMVKLNLYATKPVKKYKSTTNKSCTGSRYVANLLNQDLSATAPNQKWVSDITETKVRGKKLYLAVIIDLYSRKVIGWSMNNHMRSGLIIDALNMAMNNRAYPKYVLLHSDRGSQYASYKYQQILKHYQIIQSMSATGCCYDNAACESFFATLKKELIYKVQFIDMHDAKSAIFRYIEAFYNKVRLHSSIGYLAPLEFESRQLAIAA